MKIAMVSHYFESHRGGVEIAAGNLARALTALGHSVTWIACGTDPPPANDSVCACDVSLPASNWIERTIGVPYPFLLPAALPQLTRVLRHADALVVQDASFLPCLAAQLCTWYVNIPAIVIQHVGFVPYHNGMLRAMMSTMSTVLTKPALARADQVIFISKLTRRHFDNVRFRRRPAILFNGVDTETFKPSPSGLDRHALRESLGLDPTEPAILFVGRFVEKKGLSYLEQMARRRPEWTWLFAGWGPLNPGRWGLPNVRVFPDRSGPTLTPLYWAADALVLPSVGEGYPLVIQEALACGLPVVCGDETATADPAAEKLLVGVPIWPNSPAETAQGFLSALAEVLGSIDSCETSGAMRAAFAQDRYSWTQFATAILSLIAHPDAGITPVVTPADRISRGGMPGSWVAGGHGITVRHGRR